jgi:probable rRNA maturation factor
VISFPLSGPGDPEFSGELVISAETAARVAAEYDLDPEVEIALYLVHGLLHLCGYDDRDEPDRIRMRRQEDEILDALGLGRPRRDLDATPPDSQGPEARP